MLPHADFVPLHLHSEYSLLDGAIKINELVKKASAFRMPAVAMTDHGNLFGAVHFYKEVTKAGMKPIIGCEVYVAPNSRFDRGNASDVDEASFHLILLARNNNGYRNLVSLVSRAYTEGFYYRPRIDIDLLEQYSGGLIGLTACLKGEIPYYIQRGMVDRARDKALRYKNILGPENFFIEIQDNGLKAQDEVNKGLVELARDLHIGLVATNDCHYLNQEDAKAHDILLCIQTGKTVKDESRLHFGSDGFYLKSPEEMKKAFSDLPEAITNTRAIAERCHVVFDLDAHLLPVYGSEGGMSPDRHLEKIAYEGLHNKLGSKVNETYLERLKRELGVIKKVGYASCFLIVWDFILHAKSRGIPVGPGRGSSAGSLVAYSLDITDIDPFKYNLVFERFLNPERISMPDIDVDICKDRRPEVISYVTEKYGKDRVAQIITFGTLAAKAVIRDVGRAMDFPYAEVDRIAKLVPNTLNIKIEDAMEAEPQLSELYNSNTKIKELIDVAKRLQGLSRHASTHAAGVVISPTPITDYVPLYKNPSEEALVTQFDMKSIEQTGLLKFDLLGLKTLTVIDKTMKYIWQKDREFSLSDIPFDDAKTYELLSSGHSTGIFQLESQGMRELLRKLAPNRFDDIIAIVALYRPGPISSGMIDDFIKRKKGLTQSEYALPELKGILEESYGVILYQEQVMRIANKLANFTMGQADILRKAMGKKMPEEMEKQKKVFVKGALANKIHETAAIEIFDQMAKFAYYGFNKSHAAAYAYLTYQTAYLKAHYPVEFMAANLSCDMDNTDKIVKSINECRDMGITKLPPDINLSGQEFMVVGNAIRFGLEAVKGAGAAAIESIIETRNADGEFTSVMNFMERVDQRKVNRKVVESLIKAGAFDSLNTTRSAAMEEMNAFYGSSSRVHAARIFGQQSIFGNVTDDASAGKEEWDAEELLRYEKEALGFYLTGHPLMRYSRQLEWRHIRKSSELEDIPDGEEIRIAGILTGVKKIQTKAKNNMMAYLTVEDPEGTIEVIVFPELFKNNIEILQKDMLVLIKGNVDRTEKGIKIVSTGISRLDGFSDDNMKVEIRVAYPFSNGMNLKSLSSLLSGYKGECPIYLRVSLQDMEALIATGMRITPYNEVISRIEEIAGSGAVVFQ
jgi:DNA polymerase-3 subunit alpha